MKDRVMEEVRRLFKPEFLNRIDEIIVFHQLNKEDMKGIVEIMLSSIEKRTREQLNLHLSVSEEAKALLIEKGYDEKLSLIHIYCGDKGGGRSQHRYTDFDRKRSETVCSGQDHYDTGA